MAQTLGNAESPMHHLIMGGPAPNGAWRQVTFLLTVPLPRTLCLAVCKTLLAWVGGSMSSEPA